MWEIVNFFGPRKESLTGTVVAMLLPAYDGDEHRFTIEVPTKGEPGMVVEYERERYGLAAVRCQHHGLPRK